MQDTSEHNRPIQSDDSPKSLKLFDSPKRPRAEDYPGQILLSYYTESRVYHNAILPHKGPVDSIKVIKTLVKYVIASHQAYSENTGAKIIPVDAKDVLQPYLVSDSFEIFAEGKLLLLKTKDDKPLNRTILGNPEEMSTTIKSAKNKNIRRGIIHHLAIELSNSLISLRRVPKDLQD